MTNVLEKQTATLGRILVVGHENKLFQARVVDCVAGTDMPKRVRIVNDVLLQGKVLMPGDYVIKGFADED